METPRSWVFRLSRFIVRTAVLLMPRGERADWRDDWEGEIWHRFRRVERMGGLDARASLALVVASLGAFSHAFYLRFRDFRMEHMIQDLHYAVRQWVRSPGFLAVVLLSLGLGIGANTLIFSLVDGVILRPFPYPNIDRLVAIGVTFPKLSTEEEFIEAHSAQEYVDLAAESRTLERLLGFDLGNRDLGGVEEPERLLTAFVWGDPFRTLDVQPVLGRGFTPGEIDRQEPVAILSHRIWRERFGGDAAIVGRPIVVDGVSRTLVGIMPPRLLLLETDLWLPMWAKPSELPRTRRQFNVLARLRDGVSREEAGAELESLARRLEREHVKEIPEYDGFRLSATPFMDVWAGFVGPAGAILLGAVGFVLLMACVNLASVFLAKAVSRRREVAVRAALGAGRGRISRQLLTESMVVAIAGGLIGLALAYWGMDAALGLIPRQLIPGSAEIGLNGRVLTFTVAVSGLCGILFGLIPALQASRVDVQTVLNSEGRSTLGRRGTLVRRVLVVAELALAVVLLAGAGLMVRSFVQLQKVDPGVDFKNVLTMRITLSWQRYEAPAMVGFFERLMEDVAGLPGVRSAAIAAQFPPLGSQDSPFQIESAATEAKSLSRAEFTIVSPSLFSTLGMMLERGRPFSDLDAAAAPAVVVVNEAFVRRYLSGRDPLGERIKVGRADSKAPWASVVGVVSDAHNRGLARDPRPEIFAPLRQTAGWNNQLFLLVRTEGDALGLLPAVRRSVRAIDPDQPVYAIRTLEDSFKGAIARERIGTLVLAVLAVVALALAAVGIYGVVSQTVQDRVRDIGIRMALGAGRADVMKWIVRQALAVAAVGVAVGLLGAVVLSRALTRLLFNVSPTDAWTLGSVAVLLAGVALAASYVPARRASKLDPVAAIRTT